LLAFRVVVVVFDAPVLALVEGRNGVGVPATFHASGWDGAVHGGGWMAMRFSLWNTARGEWHVLVISRRH
jgi:hypothetical protein